VESFIHEYCGQMGTVIIDNLTTQELAELSGVSLATCHNAVKDLVDLGRLVVIKASTRRMNHIYVYKSQDFGNRKILVEVSYINQLIDKINQLEKGGKNHE
jgi:predicted transcriptional regulator